MLALSLAGTAHAATITVDTVNDELDQQTPNGRCSLREAVQAVNIRQPVDTCAAGDGNDTITFAPALTGQTIVLDLVGAGEDQNLSGDLDIQLSKPPTGSQASLTIAGPTTGPSSIIIDGNSTVVQPGTFNCSNADRVLHLPFNLVFASLTLVDLTVQNGCIETTQPQVPSSGGGLLVEPRNTALVLDNVRVVQNRLIGPIGVGVRRGAGVAHNGDSLNISSSTIANNTARGDSVFGAGLYYSEPGMLSPGLGAVQIVGSIIQGNNAFADVTISGVGAYLGFAFEPGTTAIITDSFFSSNLGDFDAGQQQSAGTFSGGGLSVNNVSQQATIRNSRFEGNRLSNAPVQTRGVGAFVSLGDGATLLVDGSLFNANVGNSTANNGDSGGGLAVEAGPGQITVTDSSFVNNSLTNRIDNGLAVPGGGGAHVAVTLAAGETHTLSVLNSEFSGNTVAGTGVDGRAFGGGLNLQSRCVQSPNFSCGTYTVEVRNTTISGNQASAQNGGIAAGGGLYLSEGLSASADVTLNNVTIANNSIIADNANVGGGGGLASNGVTVNIGNSIIATNTEQGSGTGPDCYDFPPTLTIASTGFNLIGDATDCSYVSMPSDLVGTAAAPIDPVLMVLGNNGGPTQTHALLPGSPAIDTGSPAGTCETSDQRGQPRPQDSDGNGTATCDIGAFELMSNEAPTVIAPIPDQMLTLGGSNFTIDLTTVFADPEMQNLVFSATSSNPGVANGSVSGNTLTVAPSSVGTTDITVTAMDPFGVMSTDVFTVTVAAANQSPVAANPIPDQTLAADHAPVAFNLNAVFNDPDGGPLTFTASSTNTGVANAAVSGSILTIDPIAQGSATIMVTATDPDGASAIDMVAIIVTPPNQPPAVANPIPDRTLAADDAPVTFNLTQVFSDPNGDTLTFVATSSDTGVANAAINGAALTITPVAAGAATITVTANDPDGATATDSPVVTVTPANQPPVVVSPIPDQSLRADEAPRTFDLSGVFNDPDGGTLTFAATSSNAAAATASISGNTLTVTPVAVGTTTINVVATDPDGAAATDMLAVDITAANQPPTLDNDITDRMASADDPPFSIDLSTVFSDPEGGPLTFVATSSNAAAATASINGSTLTIDPVGQGATTIMVTATDQPGATASDMFSVNVDPANQPPTLDNPLNDQTLRADEPPLLFDLVNVFSDPEGSVLSFTAVSSNTSVATATITGTTLNVTPLQVGSVTINLTATDTVGAITTDTFTVNVTASNLPPTVDNPIADFARRANDPPVSFDLTAVFSDPEGGTLSFAAVSNQPSVASAAVSGTTLTIAPLTLGTAVVSVMATDNLGATTTDMVSVNITAANMPPTVVNPITDQFLRANALPLTFDLTTVFSDPEAAPLAFSTASSNPAVATATLDGNTLSIAPLAIGSVTVTVAATDPLGAAASIAPTVQVRMENRRPVAAPISDQELEVEAEKTFDLATIFTDPDGDPLSFTAVSSNPNVVTVTVAGNPAVLTIAAVGPGTATITVTARDPFGALRVARATVSDSSSSLSSGSSGGGCTLRAVGAGPADPLLWLLVLVAWGWRLARSRQQPASWLAN